MSDAGPDLDAESETARVSVTVSALTPIHGKGDLKYTASVALDVGGIEIVTHGWTLRQDKTGKVRVFRPAWRDPRTGEWAPCVALPDDLVHAVGVALLDQVPGGVLTVRLNGGAAA